MPSAFNNFSFFHDQYLTGMSNMVQRMGDHHDGFIPGKGGKSLLYGPGMFRIHTGKSLVKQNDGGIFKNRSGNGDALALPSGKRAAALSRQGMKS